MNRALFKSLVLILASLALCFGAYRVAGRICAAHMSRTADELDWLRMEFRLSEAELSRIRQLHQGYLPQCQRFCESIAFQKEELRKALAASADLSPTAEAKLREIGALRAECQAAMLRHFVEVSREMPTEQGKRYLAEMQRLTLGSHEEIERQMSSPSSTAHEHH
jgi:hypothetical protein